MSNEESREFLRRENNRKPDHIPKDLYPVIDMIRAMLKPGSLLWCHPMDSDGKNSIGEYWTEIASDEVDSLCSLLVPRRIKGFSVVTCAETNTMFRVVRQAIMKPGYQPHKDLNGHQLIVLGAGIAMIRNQLKTVAGPESDPAGQATESAL